MYTPSNVHSFESVTDREKITDAEAQRSLINKDILSFNASIDDVINWYFTSDPLNINFTKQCDRMLANGDIRGLSSKAEESIEEQRCAEIAAAQLVASVYYPNIETDSSSTWIDKVKSDVTFGMDESDLFHPDQPVAPWWIIEHCIETYPKGAFSDESLSRLSVAADLLVQASTKASFSKNYWRTQAAMRNEDFSFEISEINRLFAADRMVAGKLLTIIESFRRLPETVLDKSMHLESILSSMSTHIANYELYELFPERPILKSHEVNHKVEFLLPIVDILEEYCTGDEPIQAMRVNGFTPKGIVHEALWFIDAQLFASLNSIDANILYTTESEDAPRLGYPEYNHGVDFRFRLKDDGQVYENEVQLKSSPSAAKRTKPHSKIDTVVEKSFQEVNPKNMKKKLKFYRETIEEICSGEQPECDDRSFLRSIPKYFKQKLEELESKKYLHRKKIKLAQTAMTHTGIIFRTEKEIGRRLNRSERRRLIRENR